MNNINHAVVILTECRPNFERSIEVKTDTYCMISVYNEMLLEKRLQAMQ
jgi:hypothetical protein